MKNKRNPHDVRVVITGMGTINPIGNTVKEYWENLALGKSGVRIVKNIDLGDYKVRIGGEVDLRPDIEQFFSQKKLIRRLDRFIVLAQIAASEALADSGLDVAQSPERYGCIIGTGDGGLQSQITNIIMMHEKGMDRVPPYYCTSHIPNMASGFFAAEKGLRGPNFSINSACATSNHAFGNAYNLIKMGQADAMIAGGAEAVVNVMGFCAFGNIFALSERNDSPETASRPFDRDRDGFILAEGSGILCLEELEHAKKRGAHIYGELSGIGFSCDAYDLVAPHPEAAGAQIAIKHALEDAEINTDQVDLINAHGTSTPIGDLAESKAITAVFRDHVKKVLVHSTKSLTGHLVGAAAGIEAIACLLALNKNIIHPTINQFNRDPDIHLNIVSNTAMEKKVEHVVSNSFGFGGQNAAIVISRFKD